MTVEKSSFVTKGEHWIIECSGCSFENLNNSPLLSRTIESVCEIGGFTLLEEVQHTFTPQGVTSLGLLSESHISIHTWPECGYAAIDIFTCGDNKKKDSVIDEIRKMLQPEACEVKTLQRGFHILHRS